MSDEAASSARHMAICNAMAALPPRTRPRLWLMFWLLLFSSCSMAMRMVPRRGTSEKARADSDAAATVKNNTRQSGERPASIRAQAAKTRVAPTASTQPNTPPALTSNTLSLSSWRKMREARAPTAMRTANSRWRTLFLAMISRATLVQAIRRTRPTKAIMISSDVR